jgi:hypothetical protein
MVANADALKKLARRAAGRCWRAVEAQHRVSTMKLTDSAAEQALLEEALEETKPALPPECRRLSYLLATPFRYGAPYPKGSRFRRAGFTPGVFYASAEPDVAMAELAFHRLLFFADSPQTPFPRNPGEYTVFAADYASPRALDLTRPPLQHERARWMHPQDYQACQALADAARAARIDVVLYASVRDPQHRRNVALFACRAFAKADVTARQSWRLHVSAQGVRAVCEAPHLSLDFGRGAFAADSRIRRMVWERGDGA